MILRNSGHIFYQSRRYRKLSWLGTKCIRLCCDLYDSWIKNKGHIIMILVIICGFQGIQGRLCTHCSVKTCRSPKSQVWLIGWRWECKETEGSSSVSLQTPPYSRSAQFSSVIPRQSSSCLAKLLHCRDCLQRSCIIQGKYRFLRSWNKEGKVSTRDGCSKTWTWTFWQPCTWAHWVSYDWACFWAISECFGRVCFLRKRSYGRLIWSWLCLRCWLLGAIWRGSSSGLGIRCWGFGWACCWGSNDRFTPNRIGFLSVYPWCL